MTAGASTGLTVVGDSNQIVAGDHSNFNIFGSSNAVHASNGSLWLQNGSHSSVTGNNNAIGLVSNTSLIASGTGDSVDVVGTGNLIRTDNPTGITIESGAGVTLAGNSDHVRLATNAFVIASGTGNAVEAAGTSDNVLGDNMTIAVDAGAGVGIQGSGNAISIAGGSVIVLNGSLNQIEVSGAGGVNITQGQGNTIASNATSMSLGDATASTLNGSNDTVSLGNNATLTVRGASDTVNASGPASLDMQGGALVISVVPVQVWSGSQLVWATQIVTTDTGNVVNTAGGTVTIHSGSRVSVNAASPNVTVNFSDYGSSQVTLTNNGNGNVTAATPDGNQDSFHGVQFIRFSDGETGFFNFNFVDTTLSYGNGHTYLTGPGGTVYDVTHTGHLFFNDGHIDEADGTPLVDDLYYDAAYHDVYLAGIDPDAHYAANGWHEGRNPNAYFNTNYYETAHGVNPLVHYDQMGGWQEGIDPSPLFSTSGYLAANSDVAAAGIDPLQHYLQFGMTEGRTPLGEAAPIARLYWGLLDRAPDAAGLRAWEGAFAQGTSLQSIAQIFIGSGEYQYWHGTTQTNQQFVDALYLEALGRPADASGEQAWMGALAQGTTRAAVAVDFTESAEPTRILRLLSKWD